MDILIPILVFGSTFALLALWAFASRKSSKGCCGTNERDEDKSCSQENNSDKS